MEVLELAERQKPLIDSLIEVWEKSVKETHLFLPENEIINIKQNFLPGALINISHLIIAKNIYVIARR